MITQELVKSLFDYDSNTGIFTRKVTVANNAKAGQILNTMGTDGYLRTSINRKPFKVHRLAWLYIYGELPTYTIDHINRIRDDNRIENLREVTSFQNAWNMKIKLGSSGVKGVTWDKAHKKWLAQLRAKNKKIYIGRFKSLEDAEQAYKNYLQLHHGEYTRDGTLL